MQRRLIFLIASVFYLIVVLLSAGNELFWDSVLLSGKYGLHFYQHFFTTAFVPEALAGYPPLWGYYLAIVWKLTGGPSLFWSHIAMWPILMLLVYNAFSFTDSLGLKSPKFILIAVLLLEPVLLAQSTQVAPDLALTAFFFGGLAAIYRKHSLLAAVYVLLLIWLSPRGGFHALALVMVSVMQAHRTGTFIRSNNPAIYPAASFLLGALIWYLPHYFHFGWVGYQPNSAWEASTKLVDSAGFVKNFAVLFLRFADYNRWALAFILLWAVWRHFKTFRQHSSWHALILVFAIVVAVQLPIWLMYSNPIGHRYLIVPFILLSWYTVELLYLNSKRAWLLVLLIAVLLATGHWAVLPIGFARGWDATLAHLPYFSVKDEAWQFIHNKGIDPTQVCTSFPANEPQRYLKLNDQNDGLSTCNAVEDAAYVLWSNVFNIKQTPDTVRYEIVWHRKKGQVVMELWQLKKPNEPWLIP